MNGTRTNQFDAPTSFITSISRRRAKVASRIVLTIRNSDDASSTAARPKKAHRIHFVTLRSVFTSLAGVLIWSTPGTFWNSLPIVLVSCGVLGTTRNDVGQALGRLVLHEHGLVGEQLLELVVGVLVVEEPVALDVRVRLQLVLDRVRSGSGSPSPA